MNRNQPRRLICGHLVIMVRTPRLGTVKSRLAKDIGKVAAWRFYRRTVADLLRRVGSDRRWQCWLWVTPDTLVGLPPDWRRGRLIRPQGGGDLGQRMARPLCQLPPGPVVIIGSDIPALQRHHVVQAFRQLGHHHAVIGPAWDGGYWLIGLRRRPSLPRGLFAGVRWSTPHALADTLATLAGCRVARLDTLCDVDTAQDLAQLVNSKSRNLRSGVAPRRAPGLPPAPR